MSAAALLERIGYRTIGGNRPSKAGSQRGGSSNIGRNATPPSARPGFVVRWESIGGEARCSPEFGVRSRANEFMTDMVDPVHNRRNDSGPQNVRVVRVDGDFLEVDDE